MGKFKLGYYFKFPHANVCEESNIHRNLSVISVRVPIMEIKHAQKTDYLIFFLVHSCLGLLTFSFSILVKAR